MFKSAKLKLTAWYLLIIMTITISFSTFVYFGVKNVAQKALDVQSVRIERHFRNFQYNGIVERPFPRFDEEALTEISRKTLIILTGINTVIFIGAGSLGYLLAGYTLKPIEVMITKQKRFISDAAHELKTPLTAMKTDLEVSLRNKDLNLNDAKNSMKSAIEEIDKLYYFSNTLLKQSKYQNGLMKEKMENIELDKLLKNIITKLEKLSSEKNIKIVSQIKPIIIKAHKESLEEVFTNLIENAIKFSKPDQNIEVNVYSTEIYAKIEIKDYGIGIEEKDLPYIFEPFYQANKSRSKEIHKGYGLGLAITKEIVEKHLGNIELQSKINEGTKFTINLPLR